MEETKVDRTETILSDVPAHEHSLTCGCHAQAVPTPAQSLFLTKKQIGQLRRQHITVVHGTYKACGHKATGRLPKNNCVDCWTGYFYTSANLDEIHKDLTEKGVKAFTAKYGTKFVRNFHGFLATALKGEPQQ